MKKILLITPGYAPIGGGRTGAIEYLVDIFLKENAKNGGCKAVVYSLSSSGTLDAYKNATVRTVENNDGMVLKIFARVLRIVGRLFGFWSARPYIKRVLSDIDNRNERTGYDLVIVENCVKDLVYIADFFGDDVPVIEHLHNDYLHAGMRGAKDIYRRVSRFWCVSKYIVNRVNGIPHEGDNKALLLSNSIDLSTFDKKCSEAKKDDIKKKYGIDADDTVYIYSGRIMREKGVLPLVRAFSIFANKNKKQVLLICGNKKEGFMPFIYYRLVKRHESSRIRMIGKVERSELADLYSVSSFQIIPSVWNEAFGLVALEGKTAGLRVISTFTGGLGEILSSSDIRVKKASKKHLLAALNESIRDGSERVKKTLDLDYYGSEALYHRIIGGINDEN